MDLYTLYGISKLVLILCIMSIMIIVFQDIIVSRIKKAKIRKILKSYEKEQDKLWTDFKQGLVCIICMGGSNKPLLESHIAQILSKYDIDRNTLDITYRHYNDHSIACITYKNKETK